MKLTEEEKEDQKKRKTGAYVAAGVFHALLFLLFFLVSWTEPDPLPILIPNDPVVMDFGGGGGSPSSETAAVPQPVENTNVVTQETPSVATTTGTNPNFTKPNNNKPKPNPLATFGGMSGTGNDGTGTGNDGTGDGLHGTGNGLYGNGNFGGRKLENKPVVNNIPEARGTIVMNIWVNQEGFITRFNFNAAKSTTNDPALIAACEKSLKDMKNEKRLVNADPKAPFEQSGTYKFEFSLR